MCFEKLILIFVTILFGELVKRLFQVGYEYAFYKNYYAPEQRALQIFRRAFYFTLPSTITLIIVVLCSLIYGISEKLSFLQNIKQYLQLLPIYWIYCAVSFQRNQFEYTQFIRENNGLNYADGMASNFFHGYLKLVIPSDGTGYNGINKRIENYSNHHKVEFATNRLIILVSDSMYIHSKIKSKVLDRVSPLERVIRNRAGVERPYQNDVYRFNKRIRGKYLYIAVEGATPLLSFFESLNFTLTATWQTKEMQREIFLKFAKYLKKLLNDWPDTQEQVELVLYKAYGDDGKLIDVGEMLLEYLENKMD